MIVIAADFLFLPFFDFLQAVFRRKIINLVEETDQFTEIRVRGKEKGMRKQIARVL